MFRTIKAKYPGSCKRCGGSIYPGDSIRYGGPGRLYHFAAACSGAPSSDRGHIVDTMAETIAADVTREYFGADR